MYSKEESQKLKREFWIQFAERNPRKWMLYDTKIKDFTFKFYVDKKKAQVLLDIEHKDLEKRNIYFEKIESLKNILEDEFIADLVFEKDFLLESGKTISRIWIELSPVSLNNPNNWDTIYAFFSEKMDAFERFYYEYQDYIKDLETNT
ncbi:DUF4268 domain-containing protein [Flavobacterium sp. '19STA2R22 D10 B1']|uniref:DUF4268 domain-containing protein n=1 Tax=Flavobacterium aerium TaxID=3037261 RepID=UPI00278BBD1C|nr:DUF4268 domain-containing protein [Flavobacterium sp. '19STA2R22 D10 B1']